MTAHPLNSSVLTAHRLESTTLQTLFNHIITIVYGGNMAPSQINLVTNLHIHIIPVALQINSKKNTQAKQ